MRALVYSGIKSKKIEFPLGGIGTGCVNLAGNGELTNWEMFGRPNKEMRNGYTHFAVKAESNGRVEDARILHGDIQDDFYGHGLGGNHSWGYGHGPLRTTMAGFPHFRDTVFRARFPYAEMEFNEGKFPGRITLEAFNPFIPSDDKDSSIPGAFFKIKIHNTTGREIKYTVAFACCNPFVDGTINTSFRGEGVTGIRMTSAGRDDDSVIISTDAEHTACQDYWYRGSWFDDSTVYWQEFKAAGDIPQRQYSEPGKSDMCTLSASVSIPPFGDGEIRFLLSWYIKYFVKSWGVAPGSEAPRWKNQYAGVFGSHDDLLRYAYAEWNRLDRESRLFSEALMSSSLPEPVIEAVSANLAILKSSTCMRLENGEFYAFEGSNRNSGSCEGSCTHVWNYAYALPFLFPKLERSMRELDYTYNQRPDGGMQFRLMLPLGSPSNGHRPCVDGQMGGVIKFYREWKLSGDEEWLKKWWPSVQRSLEYAWSNENRDVWDPERSGVITGRQHHTLDVELFGANSWLTGFYLAALTAAREICEHLDDKKHAEEYSDMISRGKRYLEKELFNGQYYIQKIDLDDRTTMEKTCGDDEDGKKFYWDSEISELKYQYGEGCEIDQMVAQWHASLLGLGDIFDREHRRSAAMNLYKFNFKCMRDIFNPCRLYSVNDEKGMLICTWPEGVRKPRIPIPYSEETMCGFEYAAAGLFLQNGMEAECIDVVRAIREKYDGEKRNPFGEIECGASYARYMASYALLLIYSGFRFDMSKGEIGFLPLHAEEGYSSFWSVDGAWGTVRYENRRWIFSVLYGSTEIRRFVLPVTDIKRVDKDGEGVGYDLKDGVIFFDKPQKLISGNSLIFAI